MTAELRDLLSGQVEGRRVRHPGQKWRESKDVRLDMKVMFRIKCRVKNARGPLCTSPHLASAGVAWPYPATPAPPCNPPLNIPSLLELCDPGNEPQRRTMFPCARRGGMAAANAAVAPRD